MGDPKGAVRMNISVPGDLKREMDEASESVNWSAVAAEAFRTKLTELKANRRGATMDEVIARLKAANELEADEAFQEGLKLGGEWASQEATPKDLRKLEKFDREEGVRELFSQEDSGYNLAGRIGWDDPDSFWEAAVGDGWRESVDEQHFVDGFITGAMKVWSAVKHKL